MKRPWLLFLHGINAGNEDPWRTPLNDALTRFGYEPFASERVLTPDYSAALRGELTGAQATRNIWKRPPKDELRRATTEYLTRMACLETLLRPHSNATPSRVQPPDLAKVPPFAPVIDDARRYARSSDVRSAVHQIVLRCLEEVPDGSRIVILAHSLGSVIAADIIKKLRSNLRVSALVTIGSPLGAISEFRSRDLDDYPFDRLAAWVNIFEPRDPVTGGRGISSHYSWAIDVPVTLQDWMIPVLIHRHGAEYYCTHGAVAAAITGALLGSDLATLGEPDCGVKGLELLLLQSLYLREVAKRLPTDDLERAARLERARQATAASHVSAAALIHDRNPATASLPASEFLQRPDAHIRGAWDDRTVLALAITLASGPPAPPFVIEDTSDTEERRLALVSTLSLIRAHRAEPTDVDIVDAIFSTKPAISELMAAPGRSWVPAALLTAGVLTLAATGVGLAAAAPAGLAGAALITSTLAAFGPGGMVGGMATLAALAGAGSAMAAAGGAILGAVGGPRLTPDLLANALDGAIASSDPEPLRSLLTSLLTLVAAQERLRFPTQRDHVLLACTSAQAQLSLRVAEHSAIDSKSGAAKAAKDMLALLEKACRWLRGEEKPDSADAREWNQISTSYSQALNGRPEAFMELVAGPGRASPERPALEGPDSD